MNALSLACAAAAVILLASALVLLAQRNAAARAAARLAFVEQRLAPGAPPARRAPAQRLAEDIDRLPMVGGWLLRAGIAADSRRLLWSVLVAMAAVVLAMLWLGSLAAAVVAVLCAVGGRFWLWLLAARREARTIRQLPTFLDALVRQMTIGTSLPSAFQQIAPNTDAPLGEMLARAARLSQAGIDLDVAVKQTARHHGIEPLYVIGAVLGIAVRFGGRSDQVLDRIAGLLRDAEQARDELAALSAETRLSAWILGLLPLGIGGFLVLYNNSLFVSMWADPTGARMLVGAAALQAVGCILLYRLARSL
ncbi:type II secretion system F family protein [Chitinasiproducens palmae]|uniref:Tight adherence protein B n=1 Tax=Chitinasiproducens palmae TaxID=1770053 RepID=A0A1H2PW71_9BURK|nr:type II secretion system F family protein [Chitinasiproducens palmae]SDV51158.1 tight adherence protein B [Chitinasiproducens palmae]